MLNRKMESLYAEHATTGFRRIFLALVCGAVFGFVYALRHRAKENLTGKGIACYTIGCGVAFMLVATLLQIKNMLWSGGWIAKFFAVIFFILGIAAIIALMCFAASRML